VNFSSTLGSSLIVWTRNSVQNGVLRIAFDMRTQIYFVIKMEQGGVYIELSPDNFLFDITILPPVNFDNFTGTIDDLIEALYAEYIPKLNVLLKDRPFKLPSVPYFNSPDLVIGDGYATATLQNGYPSVNDADVALIENGTNNLLAQVGSMFVERVMSDISVQLSQGSEDVETLEAEKSARHFYCPPLPDFTYDVCP